NIAEPAQGLLAGLARLPDLGALSAQANIDGPRYAEVMRFALSAGPLRASGQGTVDLVRRAMDLDVMADAPAMAPREDVSWKRVTVLPRERSASLLRSA